MRLKKGPPDVVLFLVVMALVGIGVIMVFSASAVTSNIKFDSPYYFAQRQLLWAVIGLAGMWVASRLNYDKLRYFGLPVLIFALLALVVVLIPGIGSSVKGSTRQIGIGFASFSPSEFAKLGIVWFLASSLPSNLDKLKDFIRGLGPYLLLVGVFCLLIMLQPDMGTTVVLAGTAYLMLVMAGARGAHMGGLAVLGLSAFLLLMRTEEYRWVRVIAFLNPWKYAQGSGFQTIQSLYALGSGGLFGMGLGRSRQKFFYLPEQHTDFIFAILGEELGYLGVMVVLGLFLVLIYRGFRIAMKAPDTFGSLLAAGLTTMIAVQAAINMGVVSGCLPVTGVPLPFISYGGSSLVVSLFAVGLLLNISRYCDDR